ncbi:MFS transporter [Priestia koreensis]|uniref:MFS transporter n=1 Tax=Priestia koreensis TaxID=284581 RepID=UPI001F57C214|nr:MFS transporter [Priestia koreensis]UNL83107.1 MFS transporter [Priestia koreensis]
MTKSFYSLAYGQSFANLGDVFYIVALISTVYNVTNSMFFVALVPFCNTMAGFLSSFLAPLFIDRYRLKHLLVYSQLCKTILLLVLSIYSTLHGYNHLFPVLFVLIFLIASLDGIANPASSALLPQLVTEEDLVKANSILSSLYQGIQLGGWAIGGVVAGVLHANGLLWFTLILYGISTIVMSGIRSLQESEFTSTRTTQSMWEGWRVILHQKQMRTFHLLIFFNSIANTVWVSAILYPFLQERLHVGTQWWSYLNVSMLIGLTLAGFIGMKYSEFIETKHTLLLIGTTGIIVLTTLSFGLNQLPIIAVIIIGLNGVAQELQSLCIHTTIQRLVKEKLLAKVYAAQGSLVMLTFGLSTVLMGLIGDHIHIVAVYLLAGVSVGSSLVVLLLSQRSANKIIDLEL